MNSRRAYPHAEYKNNKATHLPGLFDTPPKTRIDSPRIAPFKKKWSRKVFKERREANLSILEHDHNYDDCGEAFYGLKTPLKHPEPPL